MNKVVVIFRSKNKERDEEYARFDELLTRMALEEFDCLEFVSYKNEIENISLSYWNSADDASKWKKQAEHLAAQKIGREKWYEYYMVQIAEIHREYGFQALS